jgi:hypothetical protein
MITRSIINKLAKKLPPFDLVPSMISINAYNNIIICYADKDDFNQNFQFQIMHGVDNKFPLLSDIYEIFIGENIHKKNNSTIRTPAIFAEVKDVFLPIRLYYDDNIEKVEYELKLWVNFLKNMNVNFVKK